MEAQTAPRLPAGETWWFEPKGDGFRCLAFRSGEEVMLQAKSGKSLNRFFPEVSAMLAALPVQRFGLDGELLIDREGVYSFEALQLRLHPAESRVRRLPRRARRRGASSRLRQPPLRPPVRSGRDNPADHPAGLVSLV
jgi:ATP-dependent DNA ligase